MNEKDSLLPQKGKYNKPGIISRKVEFITTTFSTGPGIPGFAPFRQPPRRDPDK